MCYYEVFVDEDNLDAWANRYEWHIEFEELTSVAAVLGYGVDLLTATNATSVETGQSFAGEVDSTKTTIFLSFTGNKERRRDDDPWFSVLMELATVPIPEEEREVLVDES